MNAREELTAQLYKPPPKQHLTTLGIVALSNWVGVIGNRRVRVYRGAQLSTLPAELVTRMKRDGIEFGPITAADLGIRGVSVARHEG